MLSYSTQLIEDDDIEAVIKVLKSNLLAQGPRVAEFEQNLCDYTGAKYAVAFNSATSALHGAYSVCGISYGDEIITTPISFVATSNMFVTLGAVPIWCDIKPDGNIDEDKIETLINSKTKAIVPIDFAGKPVEIQKINALAKKYNLLVIQDASHALGSSIGDKKVGSFADMTIFSFHAIKPITTSEGGAVLTDNKEYAEALRLFRSHGIEKKQLWDSDMHKIGYNLRMTEVAAALGSSQIKKLDTFIQRRNTIAQYFDEIFQEETLFTTQHLENKTTSARHLYPIFLKSELHEQKENIFKELQSLGLGVQVHYKPIYQNSFYKEKFGSMFLQKSDNFYLSEISIPCNQTMSINDTKNVVKIVQSTLKKYSMRGSSIS